MKNRLPGWAYIGIGSPKVEQPAVHTNEGAIGGFKPIAHCFIGPKNHTRFVQEEDVVGECIERLLPLFRRGSQGNLGLLSTGFGSFKLHNALPKSRDLLQELLPGHDFCAH